MGGELNAEVRVWLDGRSRGCLSRDASYNTNTTCYRVTFERLGPRQEHRVSYMTALHPPATTLAETRPNIEV
ncbi:hypothetical protein V2G26_015033 [Clonostachys chloroleuca]